MARTGIKTVTVTGISRFFLDAEKASARKEIEEEFAAEGKEIIGYNEALPVTFLGFLTQELSFTWRQSDEQTVPSGQRTFERVTVTAENYKSILDRIDLFLEDKEWERAASYCEAALDYAAKDPEIYVRYLLAVLKTSHVNELSNCSESFEDNENYKKAVRFGNEQLVTELNGYITKIKDRNRNAVLTSSYIKAVTALRNAREEDDYRKAAELFIPVSGFRDADSLKRECLEKAENCRKDRIYNEAVLKMSSDSVSDIKTAIRQFESIKGWRYSAENIDACYELLEEIKAREETEREKKEVTKKKRKKIFAIVTSTIVVCTALVLIMTTVIIPQKKYSKAMELLKSGDYETAYSLLKEIGHNDEIVSSKYERAVDLTEAGDYETAYSLLREIGYSDEIVSSKYERAVAYIEAGDYETAYFLLEGINYKDSATLLNSIKTQYYDNLFTNAQEGSYVFFGKYEQDNDMSDGKEDIKWLVLEKKDDRVLLISEYALDCQKYDSSRDKVITWETCSLRKWLNETFIKVAFSSEEQKRILSSSVTAESDSKYWAIPGNDTADFVFVLSVTEFNKYYDTIGAVSCQATKYCCAQDSYKSNNDYCWWWLRTTGSYHGYDSVAAYVRSYGDLADGLREVYDGSGAVRPVLWVSFSKEE